jgi:hypothetical protein
MARELSMHVHDLAAVQQQSFLVGVSSADRTDTRGLSGDLFAVDGSIRTAKRIVPALDPPRNNFLGSR